MTATIILAVLALAGAYTAACACRANRDLRRRLASMGNDYIRMCNEHNAVMWRMEQLTARLDAITARTLERHKRRSEANVRGWQTRKEKEQRTIDE